MISRPRPWGRKETKRAGPAVDDRASGYGRMGLSFAGESGPNEVFMHNRLARSTRCLLAPRRAPHRLAAPFRIYPASGMAPRHRARSGLGSIRWGWLRAGLCRNDEPTHERPVRRTGSTAEGRECPRGWVAAIPGWRAVNCSNKPGPDFVETNAWQSRLRFHL